MMCAHIIFCAPPPPPFENAGSAPVLDPTFTYIVISLRFDKWRLFNTIESYHTTIIFKLKSTSFLAMIAFLGGGQVAPMPQPLPDFTAFVHWSFSPMQK